jgi:hypothetical protein
MKLVFQASFDRKANVLLIKNKQRTVQGITRIVIDPRVSLPDGRSKARISTLCERACGVQKLFFDGRVSVENRVEISLVEQASDSSCEVVLPTLGRKGFWEERHNRQLYSLQNFPRYVGE